MVEACAAAGVPLMVHENFRFQSPMLEVRRVLASGAIGEPTWGRITWRTGYDIYAGQPYLAREERFILLDIGVHVLDLARVLMGEVERVYCETQSVRPGIAGEDAATITLRHTVGRGQSRRLQLCGQARSRPVPRDAARDRGLPWQPRPSRRAWS